MLAMYPLNRFDRGPQVRIVNMHWAFSKLCQVNLISGSRRERRLNVLKYLSSSSLNQITGLYVENSTSWATTMDLILMWICKRRHIPVITYIRDAHPFYPETTSHIPWHKRKISALLWRLSMWGYIQFSDALAFQTPSFAKLFNLPKDKKTMVLSPGARQDLSFVPLKGSENTLLYAGNGRTPRYGVDILINAIDLVQSDLPQLNLQLISVPEEAPLPQLLANRPWITSQHLAFDQIQNLVPDVRAVVIPFRTTPYHHLLLPIKLMDYLSYGRPMLVTRCREIANFVKKNGLGIVVDDNPESMAAGIRSLFTTPLDELNQMGQNALRLVRTGHSWEHRAQQVLNTFEEIRQSR